MLTCQVCGYTHETIITAAHLHTHGLTTRTYHAQFPGHKLRTTSASTKAKIGEKLSGKPNPKNSRARTDEEKSAISKGAKKSFEDGRINPMTGKTHSEDTKRIISEKKRGGTKPKQPVVKTPEETKERIRESVKRYYTENGVTQETKAKLSEARARYLKAGGVGGMTGKKHTEETKSVLSAKAKAANVLRTEQAIELLNQSAIKDNITINSIDADNWWVNMTCNECSTEFSFTRQIFHKSKRGNSVCPTCHPRDTGRSEIENELFELVKSLCPDAVPNDRQILGGKEIDIYIPSKNIGIEFTGLYWHAESRGAPKNHLLWKRDMAHNKGVRIITIFEDEFRNKPELVMSRLKSILGVRGEVIYGRKCNVVNVDPVTRNAFLTENHIQGKDASTLAIGLEYNGELVALASFKPTNMVKGGTGLEWELSRFCNRVNSSVVGGAGKLIKYFQTHINTGLPLISYADSRWSNGDLYRLLGFVFAGRTPPSFWWVTDNYKTRIHRAALMKHRLVERGGDPSKTGWQLAQEQGYDRIWDCGNTKWVIV